MSKRLFSEPDQIGPVRLTPLGAAIVEALPDRAMVNTINRDFKTLRVCPVSALFDAQGIREFYQSRIIPMPQHLYRRKDEP